MQKMILKILKKFNQAIKKSDLVISTGGVSVGDADYIKDVVNSLGDINFWKVAVKPGRPLAFGKIKDTIFWSSRKSCFSHGYFPYFCFTMYKTINGRET